MWLAIPVMICTEWRPLDSESNSAPSRMRSRESQLHQTKDVVLPYYHKGVQVGWKILWGRARPQCGSGKQKGDACISILFSFMQPCLHFVSSYLMELLNLGLLNNSFVHFICFTWAVGCQNFRHAMPSEVSQVSWSKLVYKQNEHPLGDVHFVHNGQNLK